MEKDKIRHELQMFALKVFFEGTCYGEAKLEERMDNNFLGAFLQMQQIRKTGGTNHSTNIPNTVDDNGNVVPDYDGKYVLHRLRDDDWRDKCIAKANKLPDMVEYLLNILDK